jgi:hypothetical protein
MIGDQHSLPQTLCVKVIFGSTATWKSAPRWNLCQESKEGLENFELEKVIQAGKLKIIMFVRRYHPSVLYPESRSDDRMPAGCSEAGYRKEVPDDNQMTGRPREDASTTKEVYRVSVTIWPIERRE